MFTQLFPAIAILGLAGAAIGPPSDEPSRGPHLKPVTVVVVGREGEAPIGSFSYQAWFEEGDRVEPVNEAAWTPVVSRDGTFEIRVPTACKLFVVMKAPDYFGDSPMLNEFVVKSTDNPRKVVVRLRRGITVKGTVRDSRTKEPIAGATVARIIHAFPRTEPEEDGTVKSDADGKYVIRGVDPTLGVLVTHPGHNFFANLRDGKPIGPEFDILLTGGLTVKARVVDSDGKPLEGVRTIDFSGSQVASGRDGILVFRNPNLGFALPFRKDGFIEKEIEREEVERSVSDPKGLVVVMERTISLTGRVVAPDGRPVAAFVVAAGPSDRVLWNEAPVVTDAVSKIPSRSKSVRADVRDVEGKFSLELAKEGKTWVGVAAEGFAAWEGWMDFKRGGGPLEVRLSHGFVVSARVEAADRLKGRIKARLVPSSRQVGYRRHSLRTSCRGTRDSAGGRLARGRPAVRARPARPLSAHRRGARDSRDRAGGRRPRGRPRPRSHPRRRPLGDGSDRGASLAAELQGWRSMVVRQGPSQAVRVPGERRRGR